MTEIRITGFGGQGVIRCGFIIGKAASLFGGKNATLTQSFGPEARGSACSAQVLVSDDKVLYPYITIPEILVAMSQEGYAKHKDNLKDGGILITDEDLVKMDKPKGGIRHYAIPATRLAEEMKNKMVANIVMFGFFTAVTDVITAEAAKKALPGSVPERLLDLNVKAFEKGYEFGRNLLDQKK